MSASVLLVNPKFPHNVGAALRASSCFGGVGTFYTPERVDVDVLDRLPREERMKDYQSVKWSPVDSVRPIDASLKLIGRSLTPVAIELVEGAENLANFDHPDDALYVFGPEDGGLPRGIRTVCHRFVVIPTFHCTNLAAAIYITLYDRAVKRAAAGLEPLPTLDGEQRGWWHSPSIEQGAS